MTNFSTFVRQYPLSPLIQARSRKFHFGSGSWTARRTRQKWEVTYYSRPRITHWSFDGTPCIVLLSRFLKSATENSTFLLSWVDHIFMTGKRDLGFLQQLLFVNFLKPDFWALKCTFLALVRGWRIYMTMFWLLSLKMTREICCNLVLGGSHLGFLTQLLAKTFVAFDKPKLLTVCHLLCRI